MSKIGIVAGNGKLPLIATQSARAQGDEVYVCAITGETDPAIESEATDVMWVKLGEIKKLANYFLMKKVTTVYFDGKITKTSLFSGHVKPDLDMVMLFAKLKDKNDDTILGAICDYLENKGLSIGDSTTYLQECLPGVGMFSKGNLSKKEKEDIDFGLTLAKESARLDVGQSVIVKDKAVLAVEAIEGTDEAIKRGGQLGHGNVIVVKVAKPNQDMRFDVPTIGPTTIQTMIDADARVLAFQAGTTIIIEKQQVIDLAQKNGIKIIGI